jgi:hypothetical protein
MKRLILVLSLSALFQTTSTSQELKDANAFDPTYTHVVYFWLKNPENETERKQFESGLRALFRNSKYTRTNFLGTPPKATREVVDDSFTYAMIVTFDSAEAQQAYQVEAPHLAFIEQASPLLERFVVYDALGLNPE